MRENVWKPPVRIGSTLTLCGNKLVLFGGFNKAALNDIAYINPRKATWVPIPVTKGKRPPERYGHTAIFHKGSLIIFGGE